MNVSGFVHEHPFQSAAIGLAGLIAVIFVLRGFGGAKQDQGGDPNAAAFFASDYASGMTGTVANLSGGALFD